MPKFAQDPRFLIAFAMLLFLAVMGMSILIWLAPIPDAEVTAGQQGLREIGDWIVKSSIGAIMGFSVAQIAVFGRNKHTDSS